jgi:hypothetical protein
MNTNTLFDEAKELITSSTLSNVDKELWVSRLECADQSDTLLFLKTIDTDLDYLQIATNMLRLQIEAEKNPSVIQTFIAQQKAEIKKAFEESAMA